MALLEASDIKKIYTSEDNITVGITDINLMFDKNEIVAITGGSGSGKSTLLRVLGGLESYEEGELYFKGLPTSHYTQEDWAEYLNTNISFIFQEYNILESFTVLENVMYALTDIKSYKERKKRAIEIIERVGLKDRIKSKGSQLSGGEKQRTVIARAVAKDSPIILADEPTGNLDSNTAHDIIDLLKEISKDKLVIIVTHNYEDVERIITRHIRLFDGKVELDEFKPGCEIKHESSTKQNPFDFKEEREVIFKKEDKKLTKGGRPADGIRLGRRRYTSRPKQNILTTILLIVASLLIFITCVAMIPANVGKSDIIKQPGRLLVATKDGSNFTDQQLKSLVSELGAKDGILLDSSLDMVFRANEDPMDEKGPIFKLGYDLNYKLDEGEPIKAPGEVILKVPYTLKGKYKVGDEIKLSGKYDNSTEDVGNFGGYYNPQDLDKYASMEAKIVGITYYLGAGIVYVDTHKVDAQILAVKLRYQPKLSIIMKSLDESGSYAGECKTIVSSTLTGREARLYSSYYQSGSSSRLSITKIGFGSSSDINRVAMFDSLDVNVDKIRKLTDEMRQQYQNVEHVLMVSQEVYDEIMLPRLILESESRQISLYFNSEEGAIAAKEKLDNNSDNRYMTFMANDYKAGKQKLGMPIIVALLVAALVTFVIVLSLVKIISASKADVSIYRTMGISNSVIKGSTFVQVYLDMIPSILVTILAYFACFFTRIGEQINFMPLTGLIVLCVVVFLMGTLVAVGFNRVIYKEKINKGLRRTNK